MCSDYPLTPERYIEEELHPLLNTHVDCLLYNLCSSDAYVCELERGELMMRSVEKFDDAWCWRYRENTKKLILADANPPKLACEHGHRLEMKVIPIVRMNDMHDMFFRFEVSDFKRANPHMLLGCTAPDWKPKWETGYCRTGRRRTSNTLQRFGRFAPGQCPWRDSPYHATYEGL